MSNGANQVVGIFRQCRHLKTTKKHTPCIIVIIRLFWPWATREIQARDLPAIPLGPNLPPRGPSSHQNLILPHMVCMFALSKSMFRRGKDLLPWAILCLHTSPLYGISLSPQPTIVASFLVISTYLVLLPPLSFLHLHHLPNCSLFIKWCPISPFLSETSECVAASCYGLFLNIHFNIDIRSFNNFLCFSYSQGGRRLRGIHTLRGSGMGSIILSQNGGRIGHPSRDKTRLPLKGKERVWRSVRTHTHTHTHTECVCVFVIFKSV